EALETLGGGWVGEEALAIAVYCALAEPDPRAALLLAVNHSGDSDSTGALVGNLLGALHGVDGLPADLRDAVELREEITTLAGDLAAVFVDGRSPDPQRYPSD
ncbi:MAG: ADP-ribosylglycohydrolase family protein, partial [Actinobacteria bacterium]|nr:ADP-ribosylglycohydrolase family protein [Actinomycetota bacterium]